MAIESGPARPEPSNPRVSCRLAACPVPGRSAWEFYLINDEPAPLEGVRLTRVTYEWGGMGHSDPMSVEFGTLAPAGHLRVWTDNGDGVEGRMDFTIEVRAAGGTAALLFEFPILYKKTSLPPVPSLDRPGWDMPPATSHQPPR